MVGEVKIRSDSDGAGHFVGNPMIYRHKLMDVGRLRYGVFQMGLFTSSEMLSVKSLVNIQSLFRGVAVLVQI